MTLAKTSSRMEIQRIQNYVQTTGYSEGQESQIRLLQTTSKRVLWKIKPRLTCTRMMGKEMLQACTLSVRQNQKKRLKTWSFFMYLYPNLRYINYYLFIFISGFVLFFAEWWKRAPSTTYRLAVEPNKQQMYTSSDWSCTVAATRTAPSVFLSTFPHISFSFFFWCCHRLVFDFLLLESNWSTRPAQLWYLKGTYYAHVQLQNLFYSISMAWFRVWNDPFLGYTCPGAAP